MSSRVRSIRELFCLRYCQSNGYKICSSYSRSISSSCFLRFVSLFALVRQRQLLQWWGGCLCFLRSGKRKQDLSLMRRHAAELHFTLCRSKYGIEGMELIEGGILALTALWEEVKESSTLSTYFISSKLLHRLPPLLGGSADRYY